MPTMERIQKALAIAVLSRGPARLLGLDRPESTV